MKRFAWTLIALVSLSGIGRAELKAGSHTLSLNLGTGSSPAALEQERQGSGESKKERFADSGLAAGGQYVYYLSNGPTVGVGIDVLNSALKEHSSQTLLNDYNTRTRLRPTSVLAIAKLAFAQGRFHPFLFGGIGFHQTSLYWDAQPHGATTWSTGSQEWRRIIDGKGSGFAGAAGIGIDVFLTERVFLGFEGRGTYFGMAGYDVGPEGRASGFAGTARGDFLTFNALARLGLRFGA